MGILVSIFAIAVCGGFGLHYLKDGSYGMAFFQLGLVAINVVLIII